MSIASGGNELETATMQAEPSMGVQDENLVVVEAAEDREVHFVYATVTGSDCTVEVSFSSSFELNNAAANTGEDIASGVLLGFQAFRGQMSADFTSAPPHWDAGEEISLHTNNKSGSSVQVRVVIGYKPIGDFERDRLRNR